MFKLQYFIFNAYKFSNYGNDKFILLLRKGVYPYEYIDDWEKFNKTTFAGKEDFHSHLIMEDITDEDYGHVKKVCKDFKIRNLGEYHNFYVQNDTLLLANAFENFINMWINICELEPAKFLSAPGLGWQTPLKNTIEKLGLSADIDMLLMVEKGIRGGICDCIYRYTKINNKYMKEYDKNKESSYLQYWDVNNLFGCAMLQKLPINNFGKIKRTSQFYNDFIKNYKKNVMKDIFLEPMFNILKNYMNLIVIYYFYMKEWKIKKFKSL